MPVGTLLLAILVFAILVIAAIVIAPVLTDLLGSGRLRKELAETEQDLALKRAEARIATKALREIRASSGDGGGLMSEIALDEIDQLYDNRPKELN